MKKLFFLLSTLMIGVMFQSCDKEDAKPDVEPEAPENGIEYVDLGLPSGTLWATCNYGATSPTKGGSFLSFGEIPDGGIPTKSEWEELTRICSQQINSNGSITFSNTFSSNSEITTRSITFPLIGGYYRNGVYCDSDFAKYWSSSIVSGDHYVVTANKFGSFSGQGEPYDFKCFVRQVQRPQ